MEFQWWYIPLALVLVFLIFGKRRGGIVVSRVSADMQILDPRFEGCIVEAEYKTFKEGTPDHIEIEIERLSLEPGEELELVLNDQSLARIVVERDHEAEFDHWSGDGTDFPKINPGDDLVVRYKGEVVLKGQFQ